MKSPLVVLGAGVFAEEIADYITDSTEWDLVGFIEGLDREKSGTALLGRPVYWIDDAAVLAPTCLAVCAVGSTKRERFIAEARKAGFQFATIVHPRAQIFPSVTLAEGVIVGAGAVIGARTQIGAFAILNRGCLVGHHVDIGSYVTLGPGCNIAAKVRIGDRSFLGLGTIVVDRVHIGSNCSIGAGALVTRDLPPHVNAVGAPARIVKHGVDRM